ncbi:MAG: hypothetical protein KAI17_05605 [Thiotrichaceae bacterium]|nr:hypothetical protein [Thiotrichaceae bacterium]
MKAIFISLFLASFVSNVIANEKQEDIKEMSNVSTAESPPQIKTTHDKSAQAYIKSAQQAIQHDHLEIAQKILKEGYQDTQHIEILSQWLAMNQAIFQTLKNKRQYDSITHFKTEFENKCLKNWATGGNCSEYERQKELSFQEKNPFSLTKTEEVLATLQQYEQLKHSLIEIDNILNEQHEIFKTHQALVKEVKQSRCEYLSFDVLSPYLARTEQLIFISKINKPEVSSIVTMVSDHSLGKLHAIKILRQATTIFAKVVDQDMIFESHSSVITQFENVYKNFNETTGGVKFDEFMIIQTKAAELTKMTDSEHCSTIWW